MEILSNLLKGVAVGLANIIPGVSGGTMALILGIYQRLIKAIHNLGPQTIKASSPGPGPGVMSCGASTPFFWAPSVWGP